MISKFLLSLQVLKSPSCLHLTQLTTYSGLLLQGKYEEAERLFRRALTVTEATLGERNPQFPVILNNFAGLLGGQVSSVFLYPLFPGTVAGY